MQVPSNDNNTAPLPTWKSAVSTSVPLIGVWTHIAWVYDSGSLELRLYVNGVLEDVETGVVSINVSNNFRIGDGGGTYRFTGAVADLWVWDRVVFPKEITNLSAAVNVGKYRFDYGYDPSVDESGFFHDIDFFNGAQVPSDPSSGNGTTGLVLDGTDDYMATWDQSLDTTQSFTVSAWAKLSEATLWRTLVAQESDGLFSGFNLYYRETNGGEWVFKVRSSKDTDTGATAAVAPATTPTSWHQVTGVFDAQRRQIQIYVDGVLKATSPMNAAWTPWRSNGRLLIGRAHQNGNPSDHFKGNIDDVYVYQGIGSVGGPLGQWRLNDAAASATVADSSGNQLRAFVYGPTLGVSGKYGTAAQFDGTDDYLGGPASLDTSKSFSVAAWVKLDSKGTGDRTAVSQMGTITHAFYLQYDRAQDRWRVEMPNADAASPTWQKATSTSVPQTGVWTHLAATYDAQVGELKLYVNGVLEATATGVVSFPASGELRIGKAFDYWHGAIDEVSLWNRVISPAEVLSLQ